MLRIYAAAALPLGIVTYMWPLICRQLSRSGLDRADAAHGCGRRRARLLCVGVCRVDDPLGRRRGLLGFAHAHMMLGVMLGIQAGPSGAHVSGGARLVGLDCRRRADVFGDHRARRGFQPALPPLDTSARRARAGSRPQQARLSRLRSEYEQQIRNAARQEERARLARDLHDAVKQQLFVIQTAGATAQARFDTDATARARRSSRCGPRRAKR